jgi:putative hemolysin
MLEGLVGDIPLPGEDPAPTVIRRTDGSWLVDAGLPIEEFKEYFDLAALPRENEDRYQTVGGFVLSMLRRIPQEADSFSVSGLQLEVLDMDEHRIDKVLIVEAGEVSAEETI